MSAAGALAGLRVLEAGELVSAAYGTKLLADLGADVVKIEAPDGGDALRRRGPFLPGEAAPDAGGLFLYLNANKRGIALDLEAPAGQEAFARLAGSADLLIHDVHPERMAALGLDYERLRAANDRLAVVSIAPFGHDGPLAGWIATDLVSWCAGGLATLNGDRSRPDLPPLSAFGEQASYQAGLNAAVAGLGVLHGRRRTGHGDHVVVSVQECALNLLELTFEYWPYCGLVASRLGAKPIQPLCFMECRDGWIFVCCVEEHQWQRLVDLMGRPEWAEMELFATRLDRGKNFDALQIFLQEWCRDQSVAELYEAGQAQRIPLAPVSTMGDLLASPHLRARGFFAEIAHPVAGPLPVPGAPYRLSATPWQLRRPAPRLGEHTDEVLADAGLEVARLRRAGAIR
jgi:crotonobetainyl-CoA:carnitine CoA-transferase CaiB-like acyl-CoA transferase